SMSLITLPIVVDAVIRASLVLAVTGLAAVTLRRASASARHLVWTLGLAGALAVPMLSMMTPRWELPLVRIAQPASVEMPQAVGTTQQVAPAFRRELQSGREIAGPPNRTSAESAAPRTPLSWTAIVFLVWAAGAAVILGRMVLGLIAVQWMSRRTAL